MWHIRRQRLREHKHSLYGTPRVLHRLLAPDRRPRPGRGPAQRGQHKLARKLKPSKHNTTEQARACPRPQRADGLYEKNHSPIWPPAPVTCRTTQPNGSKFYRDGESPSSSFLTLSSVKVVEAISASISVTGRLHEVANVGAHWLVTVVLDRHESDAVPLEVETLQHEDLCALHLWVGHTWVEQTSTSLTTGKALLQWAATWACLSLMRRACCQAALLFRLGRLARASGHKTRVAP